MDVVITVVGRDQVGIIAKVTNVIAENNINVKDIKQTTMQDKFIMIMDVDFASSKSDIPAMSEVLNNAVKDMGLIVQLYNQEIFNSMHRV